MFGLTRREQRWAAEQRASEVLVGLAKAVVKARAEMAVAESLIDVAETERLRAENSELHREVAQLQRVWEDTRAQRGELLAHIKDGTPLPAWAVAWIEVSKK